MAAGTWLPRQFLNAVHRAPSRTHTKMNNTFGVCLQLTALSASRPTNKKAKFKPVTRDIMHTRSLGEARASMEVDVQSLMASVGERWRARVRLVRRAPDAKKLKEAQDDEDNIDEDGYHESMYIPEREKVQELDELDCHTTARILASFGDALLARDAALLPDAVKFAAKAGILAVAPTQDDGPWRFYVYAHAFAPATAVVSDRHSKTTTPPPLSCTA